MAIELSWYTSELRIKIGDINSTVYTDAQLESMITSAINTLRASIYYKQFEVYDDLGTDKVRVLNTTNESPDDLDNEIILCASVLNVKYVEVNAYSRNSIKIRDIRGTIDTSVTAKSLIDNIEQLESKCKELIVAANKKKNSSNYSPKQACPQTYTPEGNGSATTFITEYNK